MAAIPQPEVTTLTRVYDALEAAQDVRRGRRVSPSSITYECRRKIWYRFRWCWHELPRTAGRMLRLFRRGNDAEAEFVADLRAAGMEVNDRNEDGYQHWYFDLGGHMGGALDGFISGVVEAPDTEHVLECKTFAEKYFKKFADKGVEQSNPEYFAQVQLYMHWSKRKRTLFVGENKNTSELHLERVRKTPLAQELIEKARAVIESPEPLERISEQPEHFKCKFCDFQPVCHERLLPMASCRTCAHSTPVDLDSDSRRGRWVCEKYQIDIPRDEAEHGCAQHVYMPALTPWEPADANPTENWVEYRLPGGELLRNGNRDAGAYQSAELYAAQRRGDVRVLLKGFVQEVREKLDGTVEEVAS